MKIVHICLCGPYNDGWGYQDNLIPHYNILDGNEVTVITNILTHSSCQAGFVEVPPKVYIQEDGVKVIRLTFSKIIPGFLKFKIRSYSKLYATLKLENPDFIFMHGIQFWDMLQVKKYLKINANCILVADNHADFFNSAQRGISKIVLHKIFYKSILRKTDKYIKKYYAITPGCKKFMIEIYGIDSEKIDYLFLGFDSEKIKKILEKDSFEKLREKMNIDQEQKVLITGGKLGAKKKVDILIKAFRKIRNPNLKLVIFGEFSDDLRNDLLLEIELDPRICYLGWQSPQETYKLFLSADLGVFLGSQSALWQQAIGARLPLLLSKNQHVEYLDCGGNCEFVDENDEDMVVKEITNIINNTNKLQTMKSIAQEIGYKKFSYEEISRKAIECGR